jgi:hypothetical protein
MTKARFKDHTPYCDKDDCKYWDRCTLAATEDVRSTCDPEIKEFHACYVRKEEGGEK